MTTSNVDNKSKQLQVIKNKISKLYIIKVAQRYNLISIKDFTEFYYEKIKNKD